jgi:hypothetical protein
MKPDAVLFGPCIGEMYWECGRFAPVLPYCRKRRYKGQDIKYIVLTREERFDAYGKWAHILVPLRIEGDYKIYRPNCFRLDNYPVDTYLKMAKNFRAQYEDRFNIVDHIFPDIKLGMFDRKGQFSKTAEYDYKPRDKNYELVKNFLPQNDKYNVLLAPRYRDGFRRNWKSWTQFYDLLTRDKIFQDYNFIICGKKGEYIPDEKNRFYDMTNIILEPGASLIGLLLVLIEKAFFTTGSQSAIPNLSLLYSVDVLEFGCQRHLHTKLYNVKNTPITFIDNPKYDLQPQVLLDNMKKLLKEKRRKLNAKSMV